MARQAYQTPLTVEEYLEGERLATDIRHEYVGGEVYAMVGTSDRHNLIALNLATALRPLARGAPCQLFMSDMKVRLKVAGEDAFYYPDLMVACDPGDRTRYWRENPCLIVEILSEDTARIDRREKLLAYTSIDSLEEYFLIAQDQPLVEIHRRRDAWRVQRVIEGSLRIECLDCELDLATIYEDVPPLE